MNRQVKACTFQQFVHDKQRHPLTKISYFNITTMDFIEIAWHISAFIFLIIFLAFKIF